MDQLSIIAAKAEGNIAQQDSWTPPARKDWAGGSTARTLYYIGKIMKPINNVQFVTASLVTTIGCVLLLLPGSVGRLFPAFIGLSSLIMMSKEERSKPLKSRDFIFIGGFIVLIIGMILWCPKTWDNQLGKWITNPLVVITVWLVLIFITYRRWKVGRAIFRNKIA